MTKTPIKPVDIRKGDHVLARCNGMDTTLTVDHIDAGRVYAQPGNADHESSAFLWETGNEWFLLDRPKPTYMTVPTEALYTLRHSWDAWGGMPPVVRDFLAAIDEANA